MRVEGPPSECPECLMDFVLRKKVCSGCGNKYEGWKEIENVDVDCTICTKRNECLEFSMFKTECKEYVKEVI